MSTPAQTLQALTQEKINSATSATSLDDLLIIKKTAEGLGCNEANIDSLIASKVSGLTSSTSIDDLFIAKKTAISEAVKGGAAVGSGVYLLPVFPNRYEKDGAVFIRSGFLETDSAYLDDVFIPSTLTLTLEASGTETPAIPSGAEVTTHLCWLSPTKVLCLSGANIYVSVNGGGSFTLVRSDLPTQPVKYFVPRWSAGPDAFSIIYTNRTHVYSTNAGTSISSESHYSMPSSTSSYNYYFSSIWYCVAFDTFVVFYDRETVSDGSLRTYWVMVAAAAPSLSLATNQGGGGNFSASMNFYPSFNSPTKFYSSTNQSIEVTGRSASVTISDGVSSSLYSTAGVFASVLGKTVSDGVKVYWSLPASSNSRRLVPAADLQNAVVWPTSQVLLGSSGVAAGVASYADCLVHSAGDNFRIETSKAVSATTIYIATGISPRMAIMTKVDERTFKVKDVLTGAFVVVKIKPYGGIATAQTNQGLTLYVRVK